MVLKNRSVLNLVAVTMQNILKSLLNKLLALYMVNFKLVLFNFSIPFATALNDDIKSLFHKLVGANYWA